MDTPANRTSMPKADVTRWVTTSSAAGVVAFLLSAAARDISGAAIPLDCDLPIGADGAHSRVGKLHQDELQPSIDVRRCKYIWLGTDLRLSSCTFIFEKNEHGIFNVHAYPFDDTTSTFIVECDEA